MGTMMDDAYAKKGAKVRVLRGVKLDSSMSPIDGGASKVQDKTDKGRPAVDDGGNPILIDNPIPPPSGVVIGPLDMRRQLPIKWSHDGSWSMCSLDQIELVEPAPEDKGRDPAKDRRAAIAAQAAATATLEARVLKLEALSAIFDVSRDVLTDQVAALAVCVDQKDRESPSRLVTLGDVRSMFEPFQPLIADKQARDAAKEKARDPADGFVTRKELGDAVAALASKLPPDAPKPST